MPFTSRLGEARNLLMIALGTAIYAFGLHYFVISNELMEGGITGIALLLNYALGISPSVTTLVLNVPLFIIGWRAFGGRGMAYTIFGTVSLSFFLWVVEALIRLGWIVPFRTTHDFILATLYAGVTSGAGLGLVFRFGGTTGGSDIVARIGYKHRGWRMGQVILFIDVAVIGTSLLYIPKEKVLYTLVAVYITSRIVDYIIEGAQSAIAFQVMTDYAEPMADAITHELDRGVTLVPARGAYSKQAKNIVYCVVSRSEVRRLKQLIRSIDPRAFIIISDVHDVLGEGFREE
ncbi:membrane protein [Gordoniibacillus kamchatkensis]|uniref:Membrane protein n=1 Tax=Gordoniibacillus kamchatkensis TaxID=1590651 RepID=A0ABR5AL27_9BACL|nr:YitT family protein [Paenibacillus sp. VKM B-2647]KIL41573.1 membrane protein [Paenibacillus sp. VKM B-2647]